MTTRTYDTILTVSSVSNFQRGNVLVGNTTGTVGIIAGIDVNQNLLKVKLSNLTQEFSSSEYVHSNIITTTGTANGVLNSTSVPFQANTMSGNVMTAVALVSNIEPSNFIAEKNAFTQNPVVRLYTLYYPGEWYPPNEAGNPSGAGAGRAWPNDFPFRFAEVVGDTAEDLQYNVTYGGTSYSPFPIGITTLDQSSEGRINELTVTMFNGDNLISTIVEDPYLSGNNSSNSVLAHVNGELVHGIDPRTVNIDPATLPTGQQKTLLTEARSKGLAYSTDIVSLYGRANATFTREQTISVNGTWKPHKIDSRDLLGGVVEIKTTFANFLDYWPEYSIITDVANNIITVKNSTPYRVGDNVSSTVGGIEGSIQHIDTGDRIHLVNPWDVSSAYYFQNVSLAAQEAAPNGIFFKPDGTKMYIVGTSGDDVNEYNLSNAWDVSTAAYVQNKSLATEETAPSGLFFKPDGTKLYTVGTVGDDVDEYTLSTPWDISSASYTQNVSLTAQEAAPSGIFFKPDGTKMYVVGTSGDDVNEYSLSNAWDVSTATYAQNKSVSAQDTAPQDIHFKYDGTKMYIVGSTGDDVNEYTLSTPWDISSASYTQNVSVAAQEITPLGLFFKPDGTKMYVVGSTGDRVNEYNLSKSFTSASIASPLYIVNADADPESYLEDTYKINQLESLTDYVATFGLVSWMQYFKIATPKRKYYKNTCQWKYKGSECQYPESGSGVIKTIGGSTISANGYFTASNETTVNASEDVCAKSFAACRLRNNTINFGAFPGVGRTVPRS